MKHTVFAVMPKNPTTREMADFLPRNAERGVYFFELAESGDILQGYSFDKFTVSLSDVRIPLSKADEVPLFKVGYVCVDENGDVEDYFVDLGKLANVARIIKYGNGDKKYTVSRGCFKLTMFLNESNGLAQTTFEATDCFNDNNYVSFETETRIALLDHFLTSVNGHEGDWKYVVRDFISYAEPF